VGRDRFAMFAYAARCSVAAIAGWHLSAILGIGEPVWAAMSALIISQVGLRETRLYSKERIAGSALGIVLSLAIHVAPGMSSLPLTVQVAAAVGMCALIAYRWPSLRVAMWTCPIVLLPSSHNGAVLGIGIERGLAVIVGASVALLFHWLAEKWPARTSRGHKDAHTDSAAGFCVCLCFGVDKPLRVRGIGGSGFRVPHDRAPSALCLVRRRLKLM
jgi:uncharacterized membrane protein YccC